MHTRDRAYEDPLTGLPLTSHAVAEMQEILSYYVLDYDKSKDVRRSVLQACKELVATPSDAQRALGILEGLGMLNTPPENVLPHLQRFINLRDEPWSKSQSSSQEDSDTMTR